MTEHRAPYDTAPLDPDASGEILPPETQAYLENARPRTHYVGCHRVHPECALVKVNELERERDEAKRAAQAQSEYIQANGLTEFEMARLKAERDAADESARQMQERLARIVESTKQAEADARVLDCGHPARYAETKYTADGGTAIVVCFWCQSDQVEKELYERIAELKSALAQAEAEALALARKIRYGSLTETEKSKPIIDKYLKTANAEPKR